MGRGDVRTKKGKIANGSFGKTRPQSKTSAAATAAPEKKTKKAAKK